MEILILVLFYYLSQNPDFSKSVQPIMEKLKDSQQMLNFLKDLSKFTQAFGNVDPSAFTADKSSPSSATPPKKENTEKGEAGKKESDKASAENEKNPQSPTAGIADAFIQNILDSYLNKSGNGTS